MGIFSKDPAKAEARQAKVEARAQTLRDKARAKAVKKGVDVEGAIAVDHTFDDSAEQFLVVFPDRVDLVSLGKVGSLFRSGAGTESIPVERISSTECGNKGVWSVLEIHTSGNSIEFRTDQISGPQLRQLISELADAARDQVPTTSGGGDVTEQLRQLGELHRAGVLTDEEFTAKKTELLARL